VRIFGSIVLGRRRVNRNVTVLGKKIVVRDNEVAYVLENGAVTGDIIVKFNVKAFVQKNIAAQDIRCTENTDLNAFLNLSGGVNCN
jgi:hypothetical protein